MGECLAYFTGADSADMSRVSLRPRTERSIAVPCAALGSGASMTCVISSERKLLEKPDSMHAHPAQRGLVNSAGQQPRRSFRSDYLQAPSPLLNGQAVLKSR